MLQKLPLSLRFSCALSDSRAPRSIWIWFEFAEILREFSWPVRWERNNTFCNSYLLQFSVTLTLLCPGFTTHCLKTFLPWCWVDIFIRLLFRYGDRAPKSFLARIFCIVWILVGIIIIAIFTAIVTASLSASIQHHFTVHGSVVRYEWKMISRITRRSREIQCALSLVKI